MALKFLDGFEQYASIVQMLSSRGDQGYYWTDYGNSPAFSTTTVRTAQTNSRSLYVSARRMSLAMPNVSELIIGFGYIATTVLTDSIFYLNNTAANSTTGIYLRRTNTWGLAIVNAANGAVLGSSAANVLSQNFWHFIEIRVKFSSSVGQVEIRLNGDPTPVLNLSNIDTTGTLTSTGYSCLQFWENSGAVWIDDLYICDTTGTVNNTFLGPISVYTLQVAANSTVQLTPSASTNASCVDDVTPDDNTTYVTGNTTNQVDDYTLTDLPITPSAVPGVAVHFRSQKMDNGGRQLKPRVTVSGVTAEGAAKTPTMGQYITESSIFEKQPDGATAWDGTAVNNLIAGVKLT